MILDKWCFKFRSTVSTLWVDLCCAGVV